MINGFKNYNGNDSIGDYVELGMPTDHDDIKKLLWERPEITHVVIPHTHIGYGAGIVEYSNCDALERDYEKRVHRINGLEYAFTRMQVIRYPELWDVIAGLAYEHPLLDDALYSEREYMALIELATDALHYELDIDADTARNWLVDNVELWADGETVYIDNDGATAYMSEESLARLVAAYRGI